MNLNTLAKLAGVSVATVSKAFSGSDEIKKETRERIFSLARDLGCFDKYNKNKFDKKIIAVICPELNSDYYNAFITILNRQISQQGGIMTVSVNDFSAEREAELFAYYSSYCKADGIIIVGSHGEVKNPFMIPAVAISTAKECENIDAIHLNISTAIEDAILYLKNLGHTDIGFAGESLTVGKATLFTEAMEKAGLPIRDEWIKICDQRFEQAGIQAFDAWMAEGKLPTAILAAYDYIAVGLIKSLRHKGLSVPEDCSVIGIDDIPIGPYLETSLSTIRTHTENICRTAVELIMKKLNNQYYQTHQTITFYSEFIPRESCGPAPCSKK